VETVFPSDLVARFPAGETVVPHASSWSTNNDDLHAQNPFPLWKAPGNALHALQWEHVSHCLDLLATARRHAATPEAKKFAAIAAERLEPALHSCQFWWASRRPMWDVTMIHRGLLLQTEVVLNAGRAVAFGSAPETTKQEARWRLAAANETRQAIERDLLMEPAP
jgi:hypothetical protein